jgi:hypothetical protein
MQGSSANVGTVDNGYKLHKLGMVMPSIERIRARDRRAAAMHEAGHFVIGRHYGLGHLRPWIWAVPTEESRSQKTWVGQIEFYEP